MKSDKNVIVVFYSSDGRGGSSTSVWPIRMKHEDYAILEREDFIVSVDDCPSFSADRLLGMESFKLPANVDALAEVFG